jgi:Thiamine monophosphate kinase
LIFPTGLVIDLSHILELSKAGAIIYEKLIPRTENAGLKAALYDGEDFELLFTLNKKQSQRFLKKFTIKINGGQCFVNRKD